MAVRPAKTPRAIVQKINADTNAFLKVPRRASSSPRPTSNRSAAA